MMSQRRSKGLQSGGLRTIVGEARTRPLAQRQELMGQEFCNASPVSSLRCPPQNEADREAVCRLEAVCRHGPESWGQLLGPRGGIKDPKMFLFTRQKALICPNSELDGR
jgi:hypothetical protein